MFIETVYHHFNHSLFFFLVVNKAKMLSAGVTETVLKFLKSEMPPVQFKLLGTLRMLIDAQGKRNGFQAAFLAHVLKRDLSF